MVGTPEQGMTRAALSRTAPHPFTLACVVVVRCPGIQRIVASPQQIAKSGATPGQQHQSLLLPGAKGDGDEDMGVPLPVRRGVAGSEDNALRAHQAGGTRQQGEGLGHSVCAASSLTWR